MFLSLTGYKKDKFEFNIGKESNVEFVERGILFSIDKDTFTRKGSTIVLKNNSDITVRCNDLYEIEIIKDGKWHKTNAELNSTSPSFLLQPMETLRCELNWENE